MFFFQQFSFFKHVETLSPVTHFNLIYFFKIKIIAMEATSSYEDQFFKIKTFLYPSYLRNGLGDPFIS